MKSGNVKIPEFVIRSGHFLAALTRLPFSLDLMRSLASLCKLCVF